ncbi:AAA family ATPase, partial [Liquorilactobacillus satsumensis]|uniref:AAA family ATPase n=1 Tax=Liquorilactobacillus satsumensis TaxID=259059 RepID=UPI0039E78986
FVGINDAGKSTIFEALDIFFKNSKIEKNDRTVNSIDDVELTAYFSDLPRNIKLETMHKKGFLRIKKSIIISP